MKELFKKINNKVGMTYIELLVAMSLLMLIIMAFTPMLLSSYNTLYKAGENQEETYEAQSSVEAGLAERTNLSVLSDFGVQLLNKNAASIGEAINLNLRRATYGLKSKIENSLESLYYGGKGTIEIISAKHVNDDTLNKKVVIRAKGFKFDKIVSAGDSSVGYTYPDKKKTGDEYYYTVTLGAYAPVRTVSTGDDLYKKSRNILSTVENSGDVTYDYDSTTGETLITLNIKNVDMTCSPIQIIVSYYDENSKMTDVSEHKKIKTAVTYLYIDSPTLIIGSNTDAATSYYTSTGIQETKTSSSETVRTMDIDARKLNTTDTLGYSDYQQSIKLPMPGEGTTKIKNVSYITNDTATGYNYYVLTGTNGTILRMYAPQTNSQYLAAQGILASETTANVGVTGRKDKLKACPVTESGSTRTTYPVFWSGDYSHQFGYSTYYKSMGYGGDSVKDGSCWYTKGDGNTGSTGYNIFSTQTKYAYYYNGMRTAYNYEHQNNRCISYVLVEKNYPLRLAGAMARGTFEGYNELWEGGNSKYISYDWFSEFQTYNKQPVRGYGDSNRYYDEDLSYVRIISMTNLGKDNNTLFKTNEYDDDDMDDDSLDGRTNYINGSGSSLTTTKTSVTVTSGVYDEGLGGMFYCGYTDGYALLQQVDNTSNDYAYANKIGWEYKWYKGLYDWTGSGEFSGYYLESKGDGTYVIKTSNNGDWSNCYNYLNVYKDYVSSAVSKTGKDLAQFYDSRYVNSVSMVLLNDVNVTFGYSSNREKVYANVTFDSSGNEVYKSYERYYFLSHYGNANKTARYYQLGGNGGDGAYDANIFNTKEHDYYNVWFPGEYYNLTETANKDGLTVAVGYTVSGSTYQWVNSSQQTNTSTALGSIYNDGVLAAKFSDASALSNLLYFKDNDSFDGTSLTSNSISVYKNLFTDYGTHSRTSVQFTAVDLLVFSTQSGSNEVKNYVAYYGTNTGRAFYSKVATATATGNESTSTNSLVNYISDLSSKQTVKDQAGGQMTEILVNGESLSKTFTSITNIVAEDQYIIISGTCKTSDVYVVFGVATKDDNGTVTYTWKKVKIASGSYQINDTCIVDKNFYAVGKIKNGSTTSSGFILGVEVDAIKTGADNNGVLPTKKQAIIKRTTTTGGRNIQELYSIAGKGSAQN